MIPTAIILGILGSLHCVGMCGPLALALPIPGDRKISGIIIYNVGRTITYSLFGLVFGLFGTALSLAGGQKVFAIIMSVVVLSLILIPGLSGKLIKNYQESHWVKIVKQGIIKQFQNRSLLSSFMAGILNGFLPCGLVYVALAGAIATGNVMSSITFMAFFGLGTIPAMMAIHWIGFTMKLRFQSRWVVPAMSMVIALLFLYKGIAIELPVIEHLLLEAGMNNITVCNGGF